ncbi:MAG TPA: CRTAC1 family protein [Thermoanaerobaculia bacterium]|nr:CRTAC1 family protein [Thermoanaerobaculia bacterium]
MSRFFTMMVFPTAVPRRAVVLVAFLLFPVASSSVPASPAPTGPAPTPRPVPFREAAAETGLDFLHFNGMTGALYFPEILGPAVALLDADGDGDLDVFVGQGTLLGPEDAMADALFPPAAGVPAGDRLFRNDLAVSPGGGRRLRFTDATREAKLPAGDYATAVATGDYDNDGRTDLYVTAYGRNRLLRNTGGGSFADVTREARVDDPRWSTAATFVDFDADGWLDLYVVNYLTFDVAANPACYAPSSRRDYCGPTDFPPAPDRLLRNRGDGTFEDISDRAGLTRAAAPGLGVVTTDADGDGRPEIYVANDGAPNQLWVHRGEGRFEDQALLAGVAVNGAGRSEAGMGVDAADADGDGDEDLVVVHLTRETNTFYVNQGDGLYEDGTAAAGLAAPSLPFTSFGTGWRDFDNDGWLDLLVVNGAVRIQEHQAADGDPFPLAQANQLFRNLGPDPRGTLRFDDRSAAAGAAFTREEVSRAAAFGDLDDDGDVDVVVGNTAGPLRLLLNTTDGARPWFGLRLLDRRGRDALGARVEVHRAGAAALHRRLAADGSFGAAHDPRVLVGLGDGPRVTGITIHWPDGTTERFPAPPLGRYTHLQAGEGAGPKPAKEAAEDRPGGEQKEGGAPADPSAPGARANSSPDRSIPLESPP